MHQIPVYLVLEDDAWLHGLKPGINNTSVNQQSRYSQVRNIWRACRSCRQKWADGGTSSRASCTFQVCSAGESRAIVYHKYHHKVWLHNAIPLRPIPCQPESSVFCFLFSVYTIREYSLVVHSSRAWYSLSPTVSEASCEAGNEPAITAQVAQGLLKLLRQGISGELGEPRMISVWVEAASLTNRS